MKYKVGDKVVVKSKDWYDKHKDEYGTVELGGFFDFVIDMAAFCGKKATIRSKISLASMCAYGIDIDKGRRFFWTDDMFDDSKQKTTK